MFSDSKLKLIWERKKSQRMFHTCKLFSNFHKLANASVKKSIPAYSPSLYLSDISRGARGGGVALESDKRSLL